MTNPVPPGEALRVLFCDDSRGALQAFQSEVVGPLSGEVEAVTAASLEGFELRRQEDLEFDVVISDLNFELVGGGSKDGLLILERARARWPEAELLLLTAYAGSLDLDEGLQLAERGLLREHVFRKTESDDPAVLWARLRERLQGISQARRTSLQRTVALEREGFFHRRRALEETCDRLAAEPLAAAAARLRADPRTHCAGMIAQSFVMHEMFQRLRRAAQRQSDVLITGETGTGKELVARALHAGSPRKDRPFVKSDLASLSAELVPAQLFGHEAGAFTGAQHKRLGLLREAHQGVFFLDEIGNLSADLQATLLRILEDRCFRPLGAARDETVDVVILAATHADLESRVGAGQFRADLLERLHVVGLHLPPLRERREDIPLLAVHFLASLRERFSARGFRQIDAAALELLARQPWPRNIRQLRNCMERLFSEFDDELQLIGEEQVRAVLPPVSEDPEGPSGESLSRRALDAELGLTLAQLARQYGEDSVREVIRDTLIELQGPPDDAQAARLFGGMKANAWRQFAFKRGLTFKAIQQEQGRPGDLP